MCVLNYVAFFLRLITRWFTSYFDLLVALQEELWICEPLCMLCESANKNPKHGLYAGF